MLHLQHFGNLIPGSPIQWALADSCDSPSSSRSEPDAAYEGIAWHTRYSCEPPTPTPDIHFIEFTDLFNYVDLSFHSPAGTLKDKHWDKIESESWESENMKAATSSETINNVTWEGRGGWCPPHELWHVTWRLLKHRNWGGGSNRGGLWPMWRALKTIFVAPE